MKAATTFVFLGLRVSEDTRPENVLSEIGRSVEINDVLL